MAINSENATLALWTLRYMHDQKAVNGLINAYRLSKDKQRKQQIIITLACLYKKEGTYDASWWWGTRPDSHGPYYKAVTWEASPAIAKFLKAESLKTGVAGKAFYRDLDARNRMGIPAFAAVKKPAAAPVKEPTVDLEKIKKKKGQVGKSSIEDVLLAVKK